MRFFVYTFMTKKADSNKQVSGHTYFTDCSVHENANDEDGLSSHRPYFFLSAFQPDNRN